MVIRYASAEDAAHVARFFAGRPLGRDLWDQLAQEAMSWGAIEVTATKSRTCLKGRTRFLWCPQSNLDGTTYIRFWYPHPLGEASERLRLDVADDGRISHRLKLKELDGQALAWFRAAYEFDVAGDGK